MKKNSSALVTLFLFIFFLTSCSDNSKRNNELFSILSEGLDDASNSINVSTAEVLYRLQDKLQDYSTKDKAEIWLPFTKLVTVYATDMLTYLKGLKSKENLDKQKAEELYTRLIKYRTSILDINPRIRKTFENHLTLFSRSFDTTKNQADIFYETFFKDISHEILLAVLNRFQSNVKIIENRVIMFCNENVGVINDVIDVYIPLINQNASILQPNEKLTVHAGVGGFMTIVNPVITINNKTLETNEMGYSEYNMIVNNKPGSYSIPVSITYTDQFGRKQLNTTTIKYTVAKTCDQ